uniref:Zinc finger domain containing protein n=1 Tax=Haemonchus contortus TaxID=6289 RepID=A0A7I4Z353_HAECO
MPELRKTGRSKLVQRLKPWWEERSAEYSTLLVMEKENHQEYNVESTGISRTKNKNAQFGKNGARKESRQCFACGKPGHVARDCRAPQSQAKAVTAVAGPEKLPGSYAALVEKWVCTTEAKTDDKEFGDFSGKKTAVDTVIFGIKAQALLQYRVASDRDSGKVAQGQ